MVKERGIDKVTLEDLVQVKTYVHSCTVLYCTTQSESLSSEKLYIREYKSRNLRKNWSQGYCV